MIVVAALLIAKELTEGKAWAWVGPLIVFLFAAPSFALPASVLGMLALLDSRVREDFIKKLDISL